MQISLTALLGAVLLGSPQDPASARPPDTWILQIEGDATTLAVTQAAAKAFPFRPRRGIESDHRVRLVDRDGKVLTTVALDLSPFCLDAEHVGQAAHVRGDVVREHRIVCTVKVPALAAAAEVRIERVDGGDRPVVLGKIDAATLAPMLRARAAAKSEQQGQPPVDGPAEGAEKTKKAETPRNGKEQK